MEKNKGAAPWIGMPVQMNPGEDTQYSSRNYSDAIATAGGLPVMLPLLAEPGILRPVMERVDGLLLIGHDSDVEPSRYGAVRADACGPAQPLRDITDFLLLEIAMQRGIPILAICFGIQSLNVFLGGTLLQDIPSLVGTSVRHSRLESGEASRHPIRIAPGSALEPVAGGLAATVNSTHHQAIDRPARGLNVIAHAPDGVIESVCGADRRQWVLGVQWHPEKCVGCDAFSQRLFETFLARCRAV